MAIKRVTRSNWDTILPLTSLIHVCASQKTTKITNPQNTTARITKLNHPRVLEGRKDRGVNGTGEQSIQISPGTGLANARSFCRNYRKTCGPFRLMMVLKIHTLVSGRFCLTCTRDKNSISSKRRDYAEDPWQNGSCLPWPGRTEKTAATASLQSHPSPRDGRRLSGLRQPSVWQETDAVRGTSRQRWSCSVKTAGRLSYGRICCLRRPPRRRDVTGKGMLFQESLLHWRWWWIKERG